MTWVLYASAAAVLWGASYFLYEQLLHRGMAVSTILFFGAAINALAYAVWAFTSGTLSRDVETLKKASTDTAMLSGIIVLTGIANVLFFLSMRLKNATLSGLIEITYPLFTALFAWIFLREAQMSVGAFVGAFLIMLGVICVSYFQSSI